MAKMFYTLDETKTALGRNEEEIKQLAREGRLREFRDGPRLMFKADQVEQLKAELSGPDSGLDRVTMASDTGAPINLMDSQGPGASGIPLADSSAGRKGDTAFADIGLSGTVGGVPSPGRTAPGESRMGTRGGITVFEGDESQRADPSAQTAFSGSRAGDQVNLEGIGSGSGLLDLTRESDDTSLGAELEEILPAGGTAAGKQASFGSIAAAQGAGGGTNLGMAAMGAGAPRGALSAPIYVEADDAMAPAFGAMALAGVAVLVFGGFVLAASVMGYLPEVVKTMTAPAGNGLLYFGLGALGILVFFAIGWFVGKSGAT